MNTLRPKNIQEVKETLSLMTENSKFIGGGTDYIIRLKMGAAPDKLCYLGYISEYRGIVETENEIIIGAYTTMTDLEESEIINKYLPALSDAAKDVGSTQIRNNGTIGGNIGNASPAGDLIPVLFMYNGKLLTVSPEREEEILVRDAIKGPGKLNLKYNQAITHVIIPKTLNKSAFIKLGSRKKVTISRIGACISIFMKDKKVENISIYLGAIGIKPVNLIEGENFLKGKELNFENISKVAEILSNYIYINTPEEFDRDYKVFASKGIIHDIFQLLKKRMDN